MPTRIDSNSNRLELRLELRLRRFAAPGPDRPAARPSGLVESRRIARTRLATRRLGQNERLGYSATRRFGDSQGSEGFNLT